MAGILNTNKLLPNIVGKFYERILKGRFRDESDFEEENNVFTFRQLIEKILQQNEIVLMGYM